MRFYKPPKKFDKLDVMPPIYLLEYHSPYWFVHRELDDRLQKNHPPTDQFDYKGKTYLLFGAGFKDKDSAIQAIKDSWKAYEEVNKNAM